MRDNTEYQVIKISYIGGTKTLPSPGIILGDLMATFRGRLIYGIKNQYLLICFSPYLYFWV